MVYNWDFNNKTSWLRKRYSRIFHQNFSTKLAELFGQDKSVNITHKKLQKLATENCKLKVRNFI